MDIHSPANAARQGHEAGSPNPQPLSKKAQKRAAKAARLHGLKLERRAREKEAKKHKRRERAQAIARGELDENTSRSRRRTIVSGETQMFDARVVVDLGFDELMSDKEINSLTSQLAYTYSANRHALHPFPVLLFTSLTGRTKQRLDAINEAGYRRWSRTEWWEEGYDRLWSETEPIQLPQSADEEPNGGISHALPARATRENIVYLTADSSEELLELNEGETYIIGGLCDHNRYKNLCLKKATDSQVRHARLPISRYMSLATRKVLTVNQRNICVRNMDFMQPTYVARSVFEILLKWIDTRDWQKAFWAVIPKRKFQSPQDGFRMGENVEQDDDSSSAD